MKKVFALTLTAAMFAVTSCGPSAEDIAAKEKATQDSLAAVAAAQATADSIAAAEAAVAEAAAAAEKAKADSTRVADSLAALKKSTPKSKPKPPVSAPKEGEGKPGDIKKGMKKPGAK